MPVVRRRHLDDIEVLFLEHLPVVGVCARFLSGCLTAGDNVGGVREHLLVYIAQRDHFNGSDLDQPKKVGLAVPAAADQADTPGVLVGKCGRVATSQTSQTSGT